MPSPYLYLTVPNVPCGVERTVLGRMLWAFAKPVPNVPCGVERGSLNSVALSALQPSFLMYRVELKDIYHLPSHWLKYADVPNVPCGVESLQL